MIYTVTFNPSLDYVVQAEQLVPGESTGQQVKQFIREEKESMFL